LRRPATPLGNPSLFSVVSSYRTCLQRQAREAEKRKKQEAEEAAKKAFTYVKPISGWLWLPR
jgi:hypothetical protein